MYDPNGLPLNKVQRFKPNDGIGLVKSEGWSLSIPLAPFEILISTVLISSILIRKWSFEDVFKYHSSSYKHRQIVSNNMVIAG